MKGRELRKWREQQFLAQNELAIMLGVHVNTVANWENDRTRIPGNTELAMEAIAQQRATQVRKLREAKEAIAHERRMKYIDQHPEHYAKLLVNARKARAALADKRHRVSILQAARKASATRRKAAS